MKIDYSCYFLIALVFFTVSIFPANANETNRYDTILITKSPDLNKVIFDGKWSFPQEWKNSSLDTLTYPSEEGKIILRTAHQNGFLYVHIDVLHDTILDKGSDNVLVCVDGKNNKNKNPDNNDYCFSNSFSRNNSFTYRGDGLFGFNGNFKKIDNPDELIIVSDKSDKNNRYSKIVHSSYEFKIPLSIFEKHNEYGFYVSVFDSTTSNFYSWPYDVERKHLLFIPSPSTWGTIISPDNSMG